MTRYEMTIQGMTSDQCQVKVLKALQAVLGVLAAEVNSEHGTAWIDTVGDVTPDCLCDAVEDWGYRVVKIDRKQRNVLPR